MLLESETGQHFVFPEGRGKATIDCLMGRTVMCAGEAEVRHLLTDKSGSNSEFAIQKEVCAKYVSVEGFTQEDVMSADGRAANLSVEASRETGRCSQSTLDLARTSFR